jgi:hypothetical protein
MKGAELRTAKPIKPDDFRRQMDAMRDAIVSIDHLGPDGVPRLKKIVKRITRLERKQEKKMRTYFA